MTPELFEMAMNAVGLAAIVASIFTRGHTRTYLALIAILNAGLAGHFA